MTPDESKLLAARLGLIRLGSIKLVPLGFQRMKKKSRKWVVAQMDRRAVEMPRKWDVTQL